MPATPEESGGPRLSYTEQLSHLTVRIETVDSNEDTFSGTGFFFRLNQTEKGNVPVIVSNKHVVRGAVTGTFHLTLADQAGGPDLGNKRTITIDDFEKRWIGHPDPNVDLAVMPIAPLLNAARAQGISFFWKAFGKGEIPTSAELRDLGSVEPVLMVGYPNGLWDQANNLPIFRSGVTATHPAVDYNGRKEFLIDAACFPGSSGSPVILYNQGSYMDKAGNTVMGNRFKFLGILWGGPQFTTTGEVVVVEVPTKTDTIAVTRIPNNLGMVIRSERILDFESMLK